MSAQIHNLVGDAYEKTKTDTRQAPRFALGVDIRDEYVDPTEMRAIVEKNPQRFCEIALGQIDSGKWNMKSVRSLPHLWDSLRDLPVTVNMPGPSGRSAPVTTSAFTLLTGGLTVAGLNAAYEMVPTVGQELVRDVDSNKKEMNLAAVLQTAGDNFDVKELGEFPLIGAGEERYSIFNKRRGYRFQMSAETIEENDTAGFEALVNRAGELAAELIEEQTLRRVTDHDGSGTTPAEPYVLHLDKAGVALFQTDNDPLDRLPTAAESLNGVAGNRLVNNALVDATDLNKARLQLASMKNSRGRKIALPMSEATLLIPESLSLNAFQILNSSMTPGTLNEANAFGPRGPFRPGRVISSPKLDDLSTSAWYLGLFNRQFVRKWKLRLELASLSGSDTENFVRNRIAMEWRVAWDCEVGAQDYVYVIQNLAAEAAPKA